MEKCKALKEYAYFIAKIRENVAEVIEMILTEYDENEFRDFLKEEAWNEGHKAGMEEGLIEGTIFRYRRDNQKT